VTTPTYRVNSHKSENKYATERVVMDDASKAKSSDCTERPKPTNAIQLGVSFSLVIVTDAHSLLFVSLAWNHSEKALSSVEVLLYSRHEKTTYWSPRLQQLFRLV
jgi:hypothetical protein